MNNSKYVYNKRERESEYIYIYYTKIFKLNYYYKTLNVILSYYLCVDDKEYIKYEHIITDSVHVQIHLGAIIHQGKNHTNESNPSSLSTTMNTCVRSNNDNNALKTITIKYSGDCEEATIT